ncbi:XrtA/PEP-CTERM system TPR-repeat protein PrsT [Roseateles koreensis]|uniref:PEP-CTERM system TPR-repeat protein PrsT n=1 Tax=Roseateles koreensis TaxID=2987526 RepID=A0ABT5KWM7_9BURK|nr:XrtA/PEP-CTERM system TPR-repeat protein PrsT [Roseateles koreensis]MDC8786187.1 PEP-CTERM system TPR-repeat protein PrsT [Roseateles koreensis]
MKINKQILSPVILSLPLLFAACSGGSAESMMSSAKQHISKNEANAAVIELKNVLQKEPSNVEARYLLGKLLLDTGDGAGAEVELTKAQDLGRSKDDVVPLLAKSLLVQGKLEPLVSRYADTQIPTAAANAELRATVAFAYAQLRKAPEAKKALDQAFASDPNNISAQLLQAKMQMYQRDFDAVDKTLAKVIAQAPENAEAMQLKGDALLESRHAADEALAAYRQAIKLDKKNLLSYSAIIWTELSQKNTAAAKKDLDEMSKVFPDHPQTRLFKGMIALEAGDLKTAQEQSQYLLKVSPDNLRTLQLAGAVEFNSNSLVQAETHLTKFVKGAPPAMQTSSRMMLAQIYLRGGEPNKAVAVLQPLLADKTAVPAAYSLVAEAYMQLGEGALAEANFEKAVKGNPGDVKSRIALAIAQVSKGNEKGFDELQAISAADKEVTADLALVSLLISRQQWDSALKAIDSIAKKQPDRPLAENLRARLELARGNKVAARTAFEGALKLDPKFYPAVTGLAALDQQDQHLDAAAKRFQAYLVQEPKSVPAQLSLIELQSRLGANAADTESALKKMSQDSPQEPGPRLLLIRKLLDRKELKQALTVAQDGVAAMPDQPNMLAGLAQVQQLNGQSAQAADSLNKWAVLQPSSVNPYMALAELYVATKDRPAARQSLTRALELNDHYLPAQRILIGLALDDGKPDLARKWVKTVQTQHAGDITGQVLEAEVEEALKNWSAAALAYQAALNKSPSTDLAIKLHHTYVMGNKGTEADTFVSRWTQKYPSDVAFVYYLGDSALASKKYAQAETYYRNVLKIQPNNAAAMNNVAWLLNREKNPAALQFAENAVKLQPKQAPLLDTLADIYASQGNIERAIEVQKQAVEIEPQAYLHRLHLAKFYLTAGKKADAKVELKKLADLGEKFAAQDEVKRLSVGL